MEGSIMHIKISLILLSILIFSGCENSTTKSDELSDDQLMQAILDADKENISMENLPSSSIDVINQDYNDYTEIDAKLASGLGYQVSMDGKGYKPGDHNEVYFNMKGRKLKHIQDRDSFKCFELVLPVTFVMPDSSSIIVEDESGYMAVRTWYGNNPDSNKKPILQYPLDIIYQDSDTQKIKNIVEMKSTKKDCQKWDDNKKNWKCFKLVYPITYKMFDGSTISMEDATDWAEIKAWHESNSGIKERPTLDYPIDITYRDGTIKTIISDEEMHEYYRSCSHKDDDKKDWVCFSLVYPITYIMSDGSSISMEDAKDWIELKTWHKSNSGIKERPTLDYPINITYRDGTTRTIISDVEMQSAREDCRD